MIGGPNGRMDGPDYSETCGPDGCGAGPGEPCRPGCRWAHPDAAPPPSPFTHYAVRRPLAVNPGFRCATCGAGFDCGDRGCGCPDD